MKRFTDFLGKNLWVMMLLLSVSLVSVSCDDDDDDSGEEEPMPEESMTITDVAVGNADFSILVAALQKVGLADDLADEKASYTVFAPTNAAFADLLSELGASGLDDISNEVLTSVLLYHVVSGSKKASMIETGYYSSLSAGPKDGYGLSLYIDMEMAKINNRAKITATDIETDNGIIHVIDKVILPMSITDHAIANPAFSSLVAGVSKADLAGALDDDMSMFTVFAPTNDAFDMFFSELGVSLDDLSKETLSSVILYHALGDVVPAAMVESGYFPTLSTAYDRAISVKVDTDGGVMLNSDSEVIATDVVATNGIIHAINKVIMPPTVVDIAIDNSSFSILVEAVVKADLAGVLSGEGAFTVFAPTNDAFEALFEALNISGIDALTKEDLIPILLAHVVDGNVASTSLSNGDVPTLNTDKKLMVNIDNGVTIDGSINVVLADIQGKNGIVHVIDKVIVP
ncbi:fasciclin domain-containing protein [Carboxylicivirga sp. M1479]|uniref:fasciclin domain-containing protein n=1 Tax=Carboxylicivirga sp. M1479 TaxID=2594476 RepID=UPI0011775A5B|nr:fasciclin domain-containing protein [Carboxylicivirga sp. M1479]TRX65701.1 fasciclin domain-containing protein [Carboxylicivirga sp. M1479]